VIRVERRKGRQSDAEVLAATLDSAGNLRAPAPPKRRRLVIGPDADTEREVLVRR